jgi:hypothetical protein
LEFKVDPAYPLLFIKRLGMYAERGRGDDTVGEGDGDIERRGFNVEHGKGHK